MSPSSHKHSQPTKQAGGFQRYAWVILAVVFIAGLAAPLNQNKVSPLLTMLMDTFKVNLSQAGFLTSVFAITGLLLALPAGLILQRLGLKISGMIAMGSLVIGSALGAVSTTYTLLLISRVIEGVGLGLIAVIGPAAIAIWFPPEKQGLPMGVWSTWMPAGIILISIVGPGMATAMGWQSVWWFSAGFSLVAFILVAFFMRMPHVNKDKHEAAHEKVNPIAGMVQALSNRDLWLLALAFACFNLAVMSLMAYFPTYLIQVQGFTPVQASLPLILGTTASLLSSIIAGAILDKAPSRKLFILIPFACIALMNLFPFRVPAEYVWIWMVVNGLISGPLAVATFSYVPWIMKKTEWAGLGMAAVVMGQNLGVLIGTPLFGAIVEKSSWFAGGIWMIPVLMLGLVATLFIKTK
jgi:predicted MFS family arabinose efflux permease